MSNFDFVDFFTDSAVIPDPYPYFDYLRGKNPVLRLPHHNVVAVTGHEEAAAVYKDTDTFSSCVAVGDRFHLCRSRPKAMTSVRRSRRTAISFRCPSTCSRWTRRYTRVHGHC